MTAISPELQTNIQAELDRLADRDQQLRDELAEVHATVEALERVIAETPSATSSTSRPAKARPQAKKSTTKPKSSAKRAKPSRSSSVTAEDVLRFLREATGPLSGGQLVALTGADQPRISYLLKVLVDRDQVEPAGRDGRSKLWCIRSHQVAGAEPAKKATPQQPTGGGTQEPTLEGRILGLLQLQRLHPREIADELGVDFGRVQVALSRLDKEGDIKLDAVGRWGAEL